MTYRLVLDATAVTAYAHGSVHLGEVLSEASDEIGALVAIPAFALISAAADLKDPGLLDVLVGFDHVYVVSFDDDAIGDWRRYAAGAALFGSVDRACAALMVAYGRAAFVVTADPEVYGGIETIGI